MCSTPNMYIYSTPSTPKNGVFFDKKVGFFGIAGQLTKMLRKQTFLLFKA